MGGTSVLAGIIKAQRLVIRMKEIKMIQRYFPVALIIVASGWFLAMPTLPLNGAESGTFERPVTSDPRNILWETEGRQKASFLPISAIGALIRSDSIICPSDSFKSMPPC